MTAQRVTIRQVLLIYLYPGHRRTSHDRAWHQRLYLVPRAVRWLRQRTTPTCRVAQHNHDRLSPARLQGGGGFTPTAYGGDVAGMTRLTAYRDLIVDPNTDVIVPQFQTDTAVSGRRRIRCPPVSVPALQGAVSPYGTCSSMLPTPRTPISTTPTTIPTKSLGYQ